jgi:glycosyltransferase involved in cell wall biosynthesis
MGSHTEIIFVEGHSSDGTLEECRRVKAAHPERDIKVLVQDGKGKGDAVRKAFAAAQGDILMILDADLTVPPEDMPKFFEEVASGKAEFVNGSRFFFKMERRAMRPLNLIANKFFSAAFSYLLDQSITDTLCGTKALRRKDYERIASGRSYFGDFDPFGDFDLLFGASKLNLKIGEVAVKYRARVYGSPQISRFRDGWLLLRMTFFAMKKIKFL